MDEYMKDTTVAALLAGAAANMRLAQRAVNEYYEAQTGSGAHSQRLMAAQDLAVNAQRAAVALEAAHDLEVWWQYNYGPQAELHKNCLA